MNSDRVCVPVNMTTSTRVLAVAFVAVVAAFIGSSVLVQRSARVIDADALRISRDAAPGIQGVSDLRSELRELQALVMRTVDDLSTPDDVAESRKRVDKLLEQAVALPTDPPEAVLLGKLHSAVRAFDESAERALEQARGGHPEQARETLRTEVRLNGDFAGMAAHELVSYNVRAAESAAQRIEAARARGNRFAWQLDGFCALIAALAAWATFRATRHVQRVQQEHHRLVQLKAEELEQFAGRVAHDILSPLSAVSMALGIVEKSPAQAPDALERARSSLSRVRRIVDGLLEFARVGEVADCAVACSPGVLLSLLGNLLRNGLKYLGNAEFREVVLRVRQRRGRVVFEVEDTGSGIPASLGQRIFEPYFRGPNTSAPGIGLGLATVKRLVESHFGSLGVRAGDRGGALFWFELDEAPASEAA